LTNLGVNHCNSTIGFVLIHITFQKHQLITIMELHMLWNILPFLEVKETHFVDT